MDHQVRWTSQKIAQRLALIEPLVHCRRLDLAPFRVLVLESATVAPPVTPDVDDSQWPTIPWDTDWGELDLHFVLRTPFAVPAGWGDEGPLALLLSMGEAGGFGHPEALVYVDGQPLASCDRYHHEIALPAVLSDGGEHLLALHGWSGETTPDLRFDLDSPPLPALRDRMRMTCGQVVEVHEPTRAFLTLARVALGVADGLAEREPARGLLYGALDEAFKVLDTREPLGAAFYDSVPAALEALQQGVGRAGAPLAVDVVATGHAHIDVAWLWTLDQTRLKVSRTFHNVVSLMEHFPRFHFVQSQAQLYDYVRRDYPALFRAIQERAAEGRWEQVGSMWVEADCNLSGGEALARQFLLGSRFFRQHLAEGAADSPVLWLPDVFGFPWSLPQLAREAGLRYFFTIKPGWNQYNRFPWESFWWQGLDGTRLLTHLSPSREGGTGFAGTYNALATPETALNTWLYAQQKDASLPLLMVYGHGDGGGGPTRGMVENVEMMGGFPATPQVRSGSAAGFFEELEDRAGDHLPTWAGELYLEFHRGTYTTQARNKQANRKSEFLLHDTEFLAALAAVLDPEYAYPHDSLRRAWEVVCLNQFHDILPGSSIGPVYVESLAQYAEVQAQVGALRGEALARIHGRLGGDLLLANPTSFARQDLAFWAGGALAEGGIVRADGQPVRCQPVEGGLLLDAGLLPPYSVTALRFAGGLSNVDLPNREGSPPPSTGQGLVCTPHLMENAFLRVELNDAGDLVRIYDRAAGREVLPPGSVANQLQAFEDRPRVPDAWDLDIYFDDRQWLAEPASVRAVEAGPLRACLELRRRVLNSDVVQRLCLAHNSPRLDFDTTVQWRERHIVLKVAFPVDVLAPAATYEIQWGNVERPTHRNTSWDWARFETCAQKWVDLSEGDYGASLLNDCKYGHDIQGNVVRLTLLRGPTQPDPAADLGEHRFVYSFLPHPGRWDVGTVAQAYALNDPTLVWRAGASRNPMPGPAVSLLSIDRPNVVVETVKQAEDGRGLIVRLYESQRRRGPARLATSLALAAAWRTNLLEEDQEALEVQDGGLRLELRPYQILTLRLEPIAAAGRAGRRTNDA